MKYLKKFSLLSLATIFVACGDNTTTSPLTDIDSISINETNISIYATQLAKDLNATVLYEDNTSANGGADMAWSSSDTDILNVANSLIVAAKNGGDANFTIDYASTFSDTREVHIKELLSINYSSDFNISDIGTPQTIYVSGNFENNETNITMYNNILWSVDSNATITELNASQITLTVDYNVSSITLSATLFNTTENAQDFNKTFY